ncbi:hypothetical protein ACOME3_001318 [Neoechinorhynchus agilis]
MTQDIPLVLFLFGDFLILLRRRASETPTTMTDSIEDVVEYLVKEGDSLQRIAIHFDTDIWAIKRLNKLLSTEIFPGKILKIPRVCSTQTDEGLGRIDEPIRTQRSDLMASRLLKFKACLCWNDRIDRPKFVPINGTVVVTPSVLMFDEHTVMDVSDKQCKPAPRGNGILVFLRARQSCFDRWPSTGLTSFPVKSP